MGIEIHLKHPPGETKQLLRSRLEVFRSWNERTKWNKHSGNDDQIKCNWKNKIIKKNLQMEWVQPNGLRWNETETCQNYPCWNPNTRQERRISVTNCVPLGLSIHLGSCKAEVGLERIFLPLLFGHHWNPLHLCPRVENSFVGPPCHKNKWCCFHLCK